jgi:hypothetical protein
MARFVRTAHRYLAPLFVLAVIGVVLTQPMTPQTPFQTAQVVLMMLLLISGVFLFVYPMWMKMKRKK